LLDSIEARSKTGCSGSQFADSQPHWNFNRRDQSAPVLLGSLEHTPISCFFSLHLQWWPSTLRFRFTISSRYAATRLFSSVKFPRSWPTTWTWWDGSIPTAAVTSPTHSHMVVKVERIAHYVLPCKLENRNSYLNKAHITERENWIDRPSYSNLHALSTISSFFPFNPDSLYHVCLV